MFPPSSAYPYACHVSFPAGTVSTSVNSFYAYFGISPMKLSVYPRVVYPSCSNVRFPRGIPKMTIAYFLRISSSENKEIADRSLQLARAMESSASSNDLLVIGSAD